MLFFENGILLTVGSDDHGSTHAFVEVGMDRTPESCADFVKLLVSGHERLDEATHEPYDRYSPKKDFPGAYRK